MKRNKSLIRAFNLLLSGLLAVFGFSYCDEPRVEYGVPSTDYTVKGTLTNQADKKPVKGIRVGFNSHPLPIMMYGVPPVNYRPTAADTTRATGEFKITERITVGQLSDNQLPVYIHDSDGEENGLFRDTMIIVDFENAPRSGKQKDWYDGELTVELNVELKPKTEGHE